MEQNGYAVLEAPNGQEALKIYDRHEGPIHLLLTDLVMPGLNGRELADRLASGPRRLKVLFMSGYAENSLVPEAAPGGEVVYLQKPFEAHLLTRKVRELLDAA